MNGRFVNPGTEEDWIKNKVIRNELNPFTWNTKKYFKEKPGNKDWLSNIVPLKELV